MATAGIRMSCSGDSVILRMGDLNEENYPCVSSWAMRVRHRLWRDDVVSVLETPRPTPRRAFCCLLPCPLPQSWSFRSDFTGRLVTLLLPGKEVPTPLLATRGLSLCCPPSALDAGWELLGRPRHRGLAQKPAGLIPTSGWARGDEAGVLFAACREKILCLLPIPNLCQAWGRC